MVQLYTNKCKNLVFQDHSSRSLRIMPYLRNVQGKYVLENMNSSASVRRSIGRS